MICRHSENRSVIGIFAPIHEIIDVCGKRSDNNGLASVEFIIRLSEDDYQIKYNDGIYVGTIDEIISDLKNMTKPSELKTHGYGLTDDYTIHPNWIELYCKDKDKPAEAFPGDYPCRCLIESLNIHDCRHIDVEKYKDRIVENPTYRQVPCIDKANIGKVLVYLALLVK